MRLLAKDWKLNENLWSIARQFLRTILTGMEFTWRGSLFSVVVVGLSTLILFALGMAPYNVNMVYMLITLSATVWFDLSSGVLAAILAFLCFDYFFIPPYFTFVIDAFQGWTAIFLFLGTAIFANQVAGRARLSSRQARERASEVTALYELATAVINKIDRREMLNTVLVKVADTLKSSNCTLFLPGEVEGDLLSETLRIERRTGATMARHPAQVLAQSVFIRNEALFLNVENQEAEGGDQRAEMFISGMEGSGPVAYLPLASGMQVSGVLVIIGEYQKGQTGFSVEAGRRAQILANHVALAVEHARLIEETAQITALRDADKLKSALLTSVSHELRTPLTAIKTATANLLATDIAWTVEQQLEFLDVIEQGTDWLGRLVSNLLDLSKIEAGALDADFGWYFLPEIVEEVATRLRKNRVINSHILLTSFASDIPLTRMDYLEIDQVLTNLIENATKYSPSGTSISVQVEIKSADEIAQLNPHFSTEPSTPQHLLVKVIDEGPGIPAGELDRIFDKFYRVHARGENAVVPGTGIGLAIAKGIIEAHGGQIWAQNRLYGGSIFCFTLPLIPLSETWEENEENE